MAEGKRAARLKLVEMLEDARRRAGEPTYRQIAAVLTWSPATISRAFSPDHHTRWPVIVDILTYLGEDPDVYEDVYREREDALLPVRFFGSTEQFYAALLKATSRAQSWLRLTYIRQWTPDSFSNSPSAPRYFDAVLEWARRTANPVQRVIGVPVEAGWPHPKFRDWLIRHQTMIDRTKLTSYDVHVFEWSGRADLRNLAILDRHTVFETWSGHNNQLLKGLSIRSEKYAEGYIESFDQLFGRNISLNAYLDALDRRPHD